MLAQAAAAQAPETGRNALDPQRGANPQRELSPGEYYDERDPAEPISAQAPRALERDRAPSEIGFEEVPLVKDNGRDPIEPSPTQTAAAPDPDPSTPTPRGIWLPIDPFLPRAAKAPDPDPGAVIPRETGPREGFATKHARYVPVSWEELPGWREGATLGAWNAFAQGCAVLVRRAAWRDTCERASVLRPADPAAAREFFEREFEAFQIRTVDLAETGILTGYFEVSLEGSRVRTIRFRHPVYGVPDDLLFLDARLLTSRRPPVHVRVEGREVVPADEDASSAPATGGRAVYRLAISRIPATLRDGKLRVRRSGDRIVPYFTRHEIERNGLASAQPIAWVDDPDRLYALHIEGSGRIRLGNGEILRVAFGEQNGHAFRPTISAAPPSAGSRGIERVVDFLVSPAAASESERSPTLASSVSDPSYIFFRQIPNTNLGPPGAMGVSLTAGSSLAVDPLVTPLGAPVFIAARQSGSGGTMKRLMVAQDTGGAIRGALRADYFLGFGSAAGMMANRMKDELRMWVLLPKHLAIASRHAASARGAGGLNCLLPDQEFCND